MHHHGSLHPVGSFRSLASRLSLFAGAACVALVSGCSAPASSEHAESSGAALSSDDQAAYSFFVGKGLANFQAAGIVGNLDQESSMDPNAVQYDGGPGRGIAQWSAGGRWDTDGGDNAVWYAGTIGQSPWALSAQLDFIWYELTTFPSYGLASLRATTNVADATIVFETSFEGCGECDQGNRIAYADAALSAFGAEPVPAPAPTPAPAPAPTPVSWPYRGMAGDGTPDGYWIVASDGGIFSYGGAPFAGSLGGKTLAAPIVAMQRAPQGGYWLLGSDGGIFTFGNAGFDGSMGGKPLAAPMVGMASTPSGDGYWLVGADGGIFTFGKAPFKGSMGGKHLNAPVVGMAATPTGDGYWLVAADGGIFTFGDAAYLGSMGGKPLAKPVVGMAVAPAGGGYWLVAADGGVFTFGDAAYLGSMGGKPLNAPIVGMAATPAGDGYWLVAGDGGIFTFGKAAFAGSRG